MINHGNLLLDANYVPLHCRYVELHFRLIVLDGFHVTPNGIDRLIEGLEHAQNALKIGRLTLLSKV